MKTLTQQAKEEYRFIGQMKRKAIERKRITEDEIEKLIEITWNHGYNAGWESFQETIDEEKEYD